ncbi:mRNA turnover protein 4 homolog [Cyclospora cayetanensis]|uniref:Ribosome assembly factor mrt4 n=2 Tax=Cyclospora cayetanensis TaxID=88456 RepID=A0A1D3CR84_9EIME|nr:mRNA turnover protein 4 homolog [Cyclospora cayetanensis]OEH73682.1 mRNA turnover 4 family protein [Cyclospora cayetanensis]
MAPSKRAKVVSLTKTKKQKTGNRSSASQAKNLLIDGVRQMAEEEGMHIYVIEVHNQKNSLFKLARDALKPGKLFFGKNKVLQVALGSQPSTECLDNVYKLSKMLKGERGILITKHDLPEVKKLLAQVTADEYAKAGFLATKTIMLEPGFDALERFPHSMEPRLRSLGLPTQLQNGKINLLGKHTVCTEGSALSVEQAQILKHLDVKMARFSLSVVGHWHNGMVEAL